MLFNNSHKMLHTKIKILTKMKNSISMVDREIIYICDQVFLHFMKEELKKEFWYINNSKYNIHNL